MMTPRRARAIFRSVVCRCNSIQGMSVMHVRRLSSPVRIAPSMLAFLVLAAGAGDAAARLHDIGPRPGIEYVSAIHRPTGCMALLEFSEKVLVGALITDPHCLPHGVKARAIPAFPRDFHVPASKRQLLRVR